MTSFILFSILFRYYTHMKYTHNAYQRDLRDSKAEKSQTHLNINIFLHVSISICNVPTYTQHINKHTQTRTHSHTYMRVCGWEWERMKREREREWERDGKGERERERERERKGKRKFRLIVSGPFIFVTLSVSLWWPSLFTLHASSIRIPGHWRSSKDSRYSRLELGQWTA